MDKELLRNGSGYVDLTAYKAMRNVMEGENKVEFNRGEIFEYETAKGEIKKALIVSADFRAGDRYLSIIVLIDEPKGQVNVPIVCEGMMYADCGMVSFAPNDRLDNFIRKATDAEMAQIDEGIARCLGIEPKVVEVPVEVEVTPPPLILPEAKEGTIEVFSEELATARAEANVYRDLYNQLLARMIGQAV